MKLGGSRLAANYKLFFFAVFMMSLILLFYLQVLLPQGLRITELKAARTELEQKNAIVQDFSQKQPDTNKYLGEIDKKVAWVDGMLPNSADIGSFLTQLEQVAKGSGVQLSEIKPSQSISKAGYQAISVEVNIRGTFAQILSFLQRLDNIKRFNIVNSIGVKSQQGMLGGKLIIVVYSFSETARTQN
ncbi:MAG: Pilus assembly protein, PilO [Firmicutes bacterium]|nr:Pilus assembly protein, PilO [Bacillota bacterium]